MTPEHRRLHPAAVLAEGLSQLRQVALPFLVVVVVGRGNLTSIVVLGIVGLVFALIAALATWSYTEWWVDDGAIHHRTGMFRVQETSVPFHRVQAIDTVRGPVQRLLGAVELHVQTAGGGARGEIVLKAVAPEVAEELRDFVRERGAAVAAVPAQAADAPAWRLGFGRLLVAALTSGSLGVLVPVVAGASQALDDVLGAEDAQQLLPDTPREALLAAAAVLAAAWILSVLGTIVAFAGFRVVREGERLRISRGIVERREASVPIARVAAIRIVESPLREPFGLAQVRLESAGYAKEPATAQALLPLVRRRDVEEVVRRLLPELAAPREAAAPAAPAAPRDMAPPPGALARPPRRALRRYVVAPVAVAAVVPIVLVALFGTPALAALAAPVLAAAFGVAAFRSAGWRLDGARLVLRERGLQRTTLIADARRLPELFARTSAFQRRARLATVGVALGSGRRAAVRHLDAPTAHALFAQLGALARS
jgi:putative membrane protein